MSDNTSDYYPWPPAERPTPPPMTLERARRIVRLLNAGGAA